MSEKLPEVTPNIIRSWLDNIATFGNGIDDWNLQRDFFEALCRYALAAQRPEERLKGDALYASHGYALAARVLQSDLYAKLDDRERAECDAMVRGEAPLSPQATPVNTVFVPNPDLMAQKTVDTVARDAARYRFRHSNYVDEDGYEYGYCKVRWKNGSVDSMLWADDEEIDAAMVAASQCGPK